MDRVCVEAEKEYESMYKFEGRRNLHQRSDETIAAAAVFTARHYKVKAIIALTVSGNSAQWLSRADCGVPIYALSPNLAVRKKLTLHRNVFPYPICQQDQSKEVIFTDVEKVLLEGKVLKSKDEILITFGEPFGTMGGSNTLKIIKLGL